MQAIRTATVIDESLVARIPALRPLLGRSVELIALDLESRQAEPQAERKISFEEFIAHRLKRPEGVPPVTLEDMGRAIIKGALHSADG